LAVDLERKAAMRLELYEFHYASSTAIMFI